MLQIAPEGRRPQSHGSARGWPGTLRRLGGPGSRSAPVLKAMAKQSERKSTKITRKAMKDDAFRDTIFWLIDWAYKQRIWLISGGVALLVAVAAGLGMYYYHEAGLRTETERFYEAERTAGRPDANDTQRAAQGRKAFEAFVKDYPSSDLASVAWMHIAALAWEQKDYGAVRKAYQAVLSDSDSSSAQRDLAHLGLAKLDEQQGHLKEAVKEYKAVSDGPYQELKAFNLGRVAAAEHEDAQARQYFQQAAQAAPGSPLAEWAQQNLTYHP